MFKIGDNVVYGGNGVMTVVDIREELLGDSARRYYVLHPYGSSSESLFFVPTDNEKLVSIISPLLSREEYISVFRSVKELPDCEWSSDGRSRTELFRSILDSCDRSSIVAMIRTIYKMGAVRASLGKKNFVSDENVLRKAERILATEISIVFGIDESEVKDTVLREIGE
jgi:RNA polymerase-interacting CarD/CdnL/TRCF family regulator